MIKKLLKKIKDLNFFWRICSYIAIYGVLLFILQNAQAIYFLYTVTNPTQTDIDSMLYGFSIFLKVITFVYLLILMKLELKIKRINNA
ncbi:MAG: hypothetical protein COA44_02150 [Arcobacter sp.]|nr:MAG: hypothetical protein COA44_02150 [Arcobacter sp.]